MKSRYKLTPKQKKKIKEALTAHAAASSKKIQGRAVKINA
tara:strand:+ start:964 stop:1083 length:120 start_codon:yes stop_codon:yes gene_type:complete